MRKIAILITGLIFSNILSAQDDFNLVPNPSFEEMDGKLREEGEINLAYPWESVTMNPVDLYSESSKSDDFAVPENKYGEEKARTGGNYAGVSFFGYRGKLPRTYLGVQLTEELKAGKQYCLKFHLSMSDRSKYSINNIGMYISKETVEETNDANLYLEPQIISVTNRVYNKQFSWEAVCGTYTAEGGEKYIVIGNFAKDSDTKQETVRLSREFSGRQTYDAYYFIDDVSVIPTDKIGKKGCACEKIAGGQLKTEYKTFGTDINDKRKATNISLLNSDGTKAGEPKKEEKKEEVKTEEKGGTVYKKFDSKSEATTKKVEEVKKKVPGPTDIVIYYDEKQYQVPAKESAKIAKLAGYLKAKKSLKIVLEGHADPSEAEVKFIGKRRGLMLKKKLVQMGVSDTQLKYEGKETDEPASDSDASKNRRVTISLQ